MPPKELLGMGQKNSLPSLFEENLSQLMNDSNLKKNKDENIKNSTFLERNAKCTTLLCAVYKFISDIANKCKCIFGASIEQKARMIVKKANKKLLICNKTHIKIFRKVPLLLHKV